MTSEAPSVDVFRGCLLGGALGDALGYPIEFIDADQIARRFGEIAPLDLRLAGGNVARISDDTQMTLFTAEGLIRAKMQSRARGASDPRTTMTYALLRWYETQGPRVHTPSARGWLVEERRLHSQRAPGATCMSALEALARRENLALHLPTIETPPNQSKGCGAVMRVAPCGLGASSREQAFELARDNGVLTHGHPSGYLSAAYFASLVWDLARGSPLGDAMEHADELLSAERGHEETARMLSRAQQLAILGTPDATTIQSLGGGWTGEEALAIAILCAAAFDPAEPRTFEQALWRAAAHSGDSDSTAAITGNLLGAMFGFGALPQPWLDVLELRDVIERVAVDLHTVMIRGKHLADYPGN
ncbi:MAG: ADP-ribosylglycohydrolase family protein [Kofleriaceae bacterium]